MLVVESALAGRCPRDSSGAAGPAVRERQMRGENRDDPAGLNRFDDVWLDLDVPLRPATLPAVSAAVGGVERKAPRAHIASIGRWSMTIPPRKLRIRHSVSPAWRTTPRESGPTGRLGTCCLSRCAWYLKNSALDSGKNAKYAA